MKKIIKISENELYKIIQKVIAEQQTSSQNYSLSKEEFKKYANQQTQKSLSEIKTAIVNKSINMIPVLNDKKFKEEQYKVLSVYMDVPSIKIKEDRKKIIGTIFIGLKPISNVKNQKPFEITAYINGDTSKTSQPLIEPFFEYTDITKQSNFFEKGFENPELAEILSNIIETNFLR